ncbi:DnaB-like helicase C-terminal domain-containing protein [Desulfoscipio geothermicus]|uniref:Primase C terminal 1 (PriCT-1) n=1 Tax=Desulfoscipio geothermicus DSM 3669 TaxID=1121426 RepID=A0A1I6EC77_9FIRM|nr:DnaB-like helicase C-terminal domain-containing protein [Desulfoscipio geothermicus]SFR15353.1 Primase C terminal 1 (PriCT-1) [Desulfoscipio geothermicus DSM 3669]
MKNPDYCWCDVAIGGVNKRNNIVNITKFKVPIGKTDCYRTVYRYPEAFKQHFENKKTVAGYQGPVYADLFPIDIDDENLEQAHDNARRVLDRLAAAYDVDLQQVKCFFSGAKGFHIMIPTSMFGCYASPRLPVGFKKMAAALLQGINYDSSIYDTVRLFRLSNTINSKTGLYKIPLYAMEILHKETADILELAKEPRTIEPVDEISYNSQLAELFQKSIREEKKDDRLPAGALTKPKDAKLCYYAIMDGVGQGMRDNCALRLAVYWRKQGLADDMIMGIMRAWNQRNSPPLKEKDIEKAIHQAIERPYDYGCNDQILQQYCDNRCRFKKKQETKITADKIYTIEEARAKYEEYVQELEKRKINLGISIIDRAIRGIAPGEVCEVLARSGVGKTAFLINVIRSVALNQKTPTLFFSLEQPLAQIYERAAQITVRQEGQAIEKAVRAGDANARSLAKLVGMNFEKVYIVEEDFLTYEDLREFIQVAETEKVHEPVRLVCIDYLGRMRGERGSQYEVTSELAKQLKRLAKELDVAVLYLHQTNRSGKTGAEPITMDMARDSGVVEEAADFVLGLWRPDIDKPEAQKSESEELRVAVLKNRKGPLCQIGLDFNKKYLTIEDPNKRPLVAEEVPFKEGELPFE